MKYLLDTNVVSELRKVRPHGGVTAWLAAVSPVSLALAAATIGELQAGIERTRRNDRLKAEEIEAWLEHIIDTLPVLAMDGACFRQHARLMRGRSAALTADAMIAATALVHDLVVVTRNTKDFVDFGVRFHDPFAPP